MSTPPAHAMAVIDIGSNSGRVVVYQLETYSHFRILAAGRASLRLVRDLDLEGRFSDAAIEHAMEALRDFKAIAVGAGARRIIAVATAATREAANGPAFVQRINDELGIEVTTVDGEGEGRYGFLGAVSNLPVEDGMVFDMGGGSAQVGVFERRKLLRTWSLPLGALRLSVGFLAADPPKKREIERLVEHVAELVERAGIPALPRGRTLVGTGGTVRNLAKIDVRKSGYPISRLHGYLLPRKHIRDIARDLAERRTEERGATSGLNQDRADSIVGGAFGIKALMAALDADEVMISGQGVREGLLASMLSDQLPPVSVVRADSITALTSRFNTWNALAAARRSAIARTLLQALEPLAPEDVREAMSHAAALVDVGRAVDFFDRFEHAATIVMNTELNGFSHHDVALLSAILRRAKDELANPGNYKHLLEKSERGIIERAAVLLDLADEIEKRCPPEPRVQVRAVLTPDTVEVQVPELVAWRAWHGDDRFRRAFGRELRVVWGPPEARNGAPARPVT
jgi:exopolyphosphatase / guanosine-5'-triphosphate,3'-diphosphate pyrophosphatase